MRHNVYDARCKNVMKMEGTKFFRPSGKRSKLRRQQVGSIGCKNSFGRRKFSELLPYFLLDGQFLRYTFADEVGVACSLSRVGCKKNSGQNGGSFFLFEFLALYQMFQYFLKHAVRTNE